MPEPLHPPEYPDAVWTGDEDLGPDPAKLYEVPEDQREPRLPDTP